MRMRFKPAERAAFTTGTVIEWRNGGHWHPGTVHNGTVVNDPYGSGFQHIMIRNTSRRGGVPHGEIMHASPTHVRLSEVTR